MVIRVKMCIRLRVSKERLENQNTYNFWRKRGAPRENLGTKNTAIDFRKQSKVRVGFIFSNLKYVFSEIGLDKSCRL